MRCLHLECHVSNLLLLLAVVVLLFSTSNEKNIIKKHTWGSRYDASRAPTCFPPLLPYLHGTFVVVVVVTLWPLSSRCHAVVVVPVVVDITCGDDASAHGGCR